EGHCPPAAALRRPDRAQRAVGPARRVRPFRAGRRAASRRAAAEHRRAADRGRIRGRVTSENDEPLSSWLLVEAGVVLLRVAVVVAVALALFLLVFLGYMTVPIAAPIALAVGYGLLRLWRRPGTPEP